MPAYGGGGTVRQGDDASTPPGCGLDGLRDLDDVAGKLADDQHVVLPDGPGLFDERDGPPAHEDRLEPQFRKAGVEPLRNQGRDPPSHAVDRVGLFGRLAEGDDGLGGEAVAGLLQVGLLQTAEVLGDVGVLNLPGDGGGSDLREQGFLEDDLQVGVSLEPLCPSGYVHDSLCKKTFPYHQPQLHS